MLPPTPGTRRLSPWRPRHDEGSTGARDRDVTLVQHAPSLRAGPRPALGRVLRRYSLDELPLLFNVLRGGIGLVGPQPQIDREVALDDRKAHRRLLVEPGLTGL